MRNRKSILTVFAILAILCLGIGYAALSDSIGLSGWITADGFDDNVIEGDEVDQFITLRWNHVGLPSHAETPEMTIVPEGTTANVNIQPSWDGPHEGYGGTLPLKSLIIDVDGLSQKGEYVVVNVDYIVETGIDCKVDANATYTLVDENGNEISTDLMTVEFKHTKLENADGTIYERIATDSAVNLVNGDYVLLTIRITNQKTLLYTEDSYKYKLVVTVTGTATND